MGHYVLAKITIDRFVCVCVRGEKDRASQRDPTFPGDIYCLLVLSVKDAVVYSLS